MKLLVSALSIALNSVLIVAMVAVYHTATMASGATLISSPETLEIIDITEKEIDNQQIYPALIDNRQAHCLALNVYYEARGSNLADMYAVSDVVLNRVRDSRYPNTICDVVYQGPTRESWKTKQDPDLPDEERKYNPVRNMCQFSWYCDGKNDIPKDETGWATAQMVAGSILFANKHRGITEGSTHYHATYVKPNWRNDRGMQHVGRIGSHIFYRWE